MRMRSLYKKVGMCVYVCVCHSVDLRFKDWQRVFAEEHNEESAHISIASNQNNTI